MDVQPDTQAPLETMVDQPFINGSSSATPRLGIPFLPLSPSPSPVIPAQESPKHARQPSPLSPIRYVPVPIRTGTLSDLPPQPSPSPPFPVLPEPTNAITMDTNSDPSSLPQTLTPPPAFPEKFRYLVCTSSWLGGRPSGGTGSGVGVGARLEGGGRWSMTGEGIMNGSGASDEHVEYSGESQTAGGPGELSANTHGRTSRNGIHGRMSGEYGGENDREVELGTIARRAGMRLRVRQPTELDLDQVGEEADGGSKSWDSSRRRGIRQEVHRFGLSDRKRTVEGSEGQEVVIPNNMDGQTDDTISLSSSRSSTSYPSSPTTSDINSLSQSTITLPLLNIASLSLTIHYLRSRPDISLAFILGLTGLTWVWKLVGTIWWQVVAGAAVLVAAGLKVGMETVKRRGWVDEKVVKRLERERQKEERRERRKRKKIERERRAEEQIESARHLPEVSPPLANALPVPDIASSEDGPQAQQFDLPISEQDVPPTSDESLQSMALEALKTVIQESDGFDDVVGKALALLGQSENDSPTNHDSDHVPHRPLRQRLDEVLNAVVTQITTSTQILLPLISQQELATFSEMYSIEDGASRRTSSNDSREMETGMGMSDASKRLSGMSMAVFSDFSEDGQAVNGYPRDGQETVDGPNGNGGQGLATAKGKRRTLTEDGPPQTQEYAVPFSPLPRLRSSQSTPFLRLGSPISQHDRFTSFPMRSPRPASRQSWTASADRSFSSSEDDSALNGSTASGSQQEYAHLRSESEALTPMRAYRYGAQPKSVQEDGEEERPVGNLPSYKLPRAARPMSMHGYYGVDVQASVPHPRPRSSQEMRSTSAGSSDLDPAFVAPPPRPTHGLRQLRLSQSSITGITGLPIAARLPSSPSDRSPIYLDHGVSGSPARPISDIDRQRKRSSWQGPGSRRPLSLHGSSPSSRQQLRGFAGSDSGAGHAMPLLRHSFGLGDGDGALQRSNSIPIRRSGHSRNASSSQAAGSFPPSTYPMAQHPFPTSSGDHSVAANQFLQTPARPRANRTVSLGPLTLSSLKASFLGMHLKRRKAACCLLALRFDADDARFNRDDGPADSAPALNMDPVELAKYWAAVHGALDELHKCLSESTATVDTELADLAVPQPDISSRHRERFSGARAGDKTISHAPKHTEAELLVDRADSMASTLRKLQMQLGYFDAETGDPDELEMKWDLIREELGGVIRDWEKGRSLIKRMLSEPETVGAQIGLYPEGVNVDKDNTVRRHANGTLHSTRVDIADRHSMHDPTQFALGEEAPADDASNYLIQATSPAFLPPPGIESVFEGLSARSMRQELGGPKLSREERIKAIKAARTSGTPGFAEAPLLSDPMNRTDRDVRTRSGEMVNELKGVIGALRKRRGGVEGDDR